MSRTHLLGEVDRLGPRSGRDHDRQLEHPPCDLGRNCTDATGAVDDEYSHVLPFLDLQPLHQRRIRRAVRQRHGCGLDEVKRLGLVPHLPLVDQLVLGRRALPFGVPEIEDLVAGLEERALRACFGDDAGTVEPDHVEWARDVIVKVYGQVSIEGSRFVFLSAAVPGASSYDPFRILISIGLTEHACTLSMHDDQLPATQSQCSSPTSSLDQQITSFRFVRLGHISRL